MKSSIFILSLLFLIPFIVEAKVKSCLTCGDLFELTNDKDCLAGNDKVKRTKCTENVDDFGCAVLSSDSMFFRGCVPETLCVNEHNDQGDGVCCKEDNCNTMDASSSSTLVPSILGFIL